MLSVPDPPPIPLSRNCSDKSKAMEIRRKYFCHSGKVSQIQAQPGCAPSVSREAILLQDSSCLPPHSSKRKMIPAAADSGDCSARDMCRCLLTCVCIQPLPLSTTIQCTACHVSCATVAPAVISSLSNYTCYSVSKQTKLSGSLSLQIAVCQQAPRMALWHRQPILESKLGR